MRTSHKYPNLVEGNITSDRYEIVKLIDGHISGLFYHTGKQHVIVDAGSHEYRIDQHGQLIDTIGGYVHWYSSGYYFTPNYYLDWVSTGEKNEKQYNQTIDGNNFSDQQLAGLFNQADVVEFSTGANSAYAYLIQQGKSTIVDVFKKFESISNSSCDESYKHLRWKKSCFEGYPKPYEDPISLLPYNGQDTPGNKLPELEMRVNGFKRRHYYLEEGLLGQILTPLIIPFFGGSWHNLPSRYWFGDALIDLVHNNETLSFRVFADNKYRNSNNERILSYDNFSVYDVPEQQDTKILVVSYLPYRFSGTERNINHLYEDNVGLYVLRKKTTASPTSKYPQSWFINVSGIEANREVWGKVCFQDPGINPSFYQLGERESHPELITRSAACVPLVFYSTPESFSVHVQTKQYKSVFQLKINPQESAWFHNPNDYTDIELTIQLDPQELTSAIERLLAKQPINKAKKPLKLQVTFADVTENFANLQLFLEVGGAAIELTEYTVGYPVQSSARLERAKLKYTRKLVFENQQTLEPFLSHMQLLSEKNGFAKEYLPLTAQYLAELVNKYNLEHKFEQSQVIQRFYIDHILRFVGQNTEEQSVAYNHTVIASQSLAAAIWKQDQAMAAAVFDELLGPSFDIAQEENGTLLFNLACYYSINKNKPQLLIASERSRQLGIPAAQFLNDADFTPYLEDEQFLAVIESQYD
jgi:hypothetical protein